MYIPKFTITTEIMRNVATVEAAREVIENAPLVPAYEAKFRDDAKMKAVHFGTALEGNDLTENETKLIIEREVESIKQAEEAGVMARPRDVQEVINYRRVQDYIDRCREYLQESDQGGLYSKDLILQIHKLVVDRTGAEQEAGVFRKSQVVLKNSLTGEIGYRPPGFLEVPFLVDDFLFWLNSPAGRKEHPIIRAGITHYALSAIHPFVEGNGRTARAMSTLVLFAEGYDIKKFFALEEYFDTHADEYFGALIEVSNQTGVLSQRDLTPWLTVFTRALALELSRIKAQIKQISLDAHLMQKTGKQVTLSPRQMKIVEYVNANGEISMNEARGLLTTVSEDTILRDFRFLLEKEVIYKKGSTKSAKYYLKK